MNYQPEFTVRSLTECKHLIYKDVVAIRSGQIYVSHCQRDVSMDLNGIATFNRIVITTLQPRRRIHGEAFVIGKLGIAADKICECAFLCCAKGLRGGCQGRAEKDSAFFEVVSVVNDLAGDCLLYTSDAADE